MSKNIAIFASGSGSNAENIIKYFSEIKNINVSLILTNNPQAYVIERAQSAQVPCTVFSRSDFYKSTVVIDQLALHKIDWIVLAGFLWLIPQNLISLYPNKIINIHPALLPKYGGKGMYGHHVHQAVFDNFERASGITIHLVNEEYDKGRILAQESVSLAIADTPDLIAEKIHQLEYKHFPKVIHETIEEG